MSNNQVTLSITGMHCGSCVKLVERALRAVNGVSRANVILAEQQAIVECDGQRVTPDALKAAVAAQGYEVTAVALAASA